MPPQTLAAIGSFLQKHWKAVLFTFLIPIFVIFGLIMIIPLACGCMPGLTGNIGGEFFGSSGSPGGGTGNNSNGSGGTVGKDCIEKINSRAKQYVDKVNEAAQKFGTDPALMLAQLQAESNFDPSVSSGVGAQGIAQFMPGTWQEVAAKYNIDGNGNGTENAFEAEDGIYAQAAYNVQLKQTLGSLGTTENIIAAYNAGPGAVQQYGGIPPYSETQNYVKNIMSYYSQYKKCLSNNDSSSSNSDLELVSGQKIILHWTAGNYDCANSDGHYTYVIDGDGNIKKVGSATTSGAASRDDAIGISVCAGAGNYNADLYPNDDILGTKTFTDTPVKQIQIDKMTELIAKLAKKNNFDINNKTVITHAEAAALKDFSKEQITPYSYPNQQKCTTENDDPPVNTGIPTCNYGPSYWKDGWPGGCADRVLRWDFWEKGDQLRALAIQKISTTN